MRQSDQPVDQRMLCVKPPAFILRLTNPCFTCTLLQSTAPQFHTLKFFMDYTNNGDLHMLSNIALLRHRLRLQMSLECRHCAPASTSLTYMWPGYRSRRPGLDRFCPQQQTGRSFAPSVAAVCVQRAVTSPSEPTSQIDCFQCAETTLRSLQPGDFCD